MVVCQGRLHIAQVFVGDATPVTGVRILRLETNGLIEVGDALLVLAKPGEAAAAEDVGVLTIWIDAQRFGAISNGLFMSA